jgi:hypothetical protein
MSLIDYKNGGRPALPYASQMASEKQVAFVTRLLAEKNLAMIAELALAIQDSLEAGLTKQAASAAIDALLPLPKLPLTHEDGNAVGEGFYWVNGLAYKVQAAKSHGGLYAKVFSEAGYEYAPGAMRLLATAERLTLEQAAELGIQTGRCVICARLLTDPESVAAGIGPVCQARL